MTTFYGIENYTAYEESDIVAVYRNKEWAEAVLKVMRDSNKQDDEDFRLQEMQTVDVMMWMAKKIERGE